MTAVDRVGPLATDAPWPVGVALDEHEFRRTMGMFATGVTVVTAAAESPQGMHGMTANAFTSVSKEPPLVLVCVDRAAVMHEQILSAGAFAVSVLAAPQERLARYFADRHRPLGPEQFATVDWAPGRHTGAPLLAGSLACVECSLSEAYLAGDHSIFVGSVLALSRGPQRDALVFYGGGFRRVYAD